MNLTEMQYTLLNFMIEKKDWGRYLKLWRPDILSIIDAETGSSISERACKFIFGDFSTPCKHCSKQTPFVRFDTIKQRPIYREFCDKHCMFEYNRIINKKRVEMQILNMKNHRYISGDYTNRHHKNKIKVKHLKCGTEFDVTVGNFLHAGNENYCPTCGAKERALKATKSIVDRCDARDAELYQQHGIDKHTYTRLVRRETTKTYKLFGDRINPDNLKIARAGEDDAYNIDHVVSVMASYALDKPIHPKVLGSVINLQMMDATDNIRKGADLTEDSSKLMMDLQRISNIVENLNKKQIHNLVIESVSHGNINGNRIEFE